MRKTRRVACVGEAIVDLVSTKRGATLANTPGFVRCAGGAAANVAVGLAKLGVQSAFVGKVGDDAFGRFLRMALHKERVDVGGLSLSPWHKTRLAFVAVGRSGERDFEFWEQNPADVQLKLGDVNIERLAASGIVHLSSFLLLDEPSRSTVLELSRRFRKKGTWVSFDPNLRLSLWKDRRQARELHLKMVCASTILRLNEEEAYFLTGKENIAAAAAALMRMGPSLVAITDGSRGCYLRTARIQLMIPGCRVKVVDTTGCGDGFLAGLLHGILARWPALGDMSDSELHSIGQFANAVGALTATRRGVFEALPTKHEVKKLIQSS